MISPQNHAFQIYALQI